MRKSQYYLILSVLNYAEKDLNLKKLPFVFDAASTWKNCERYVMIESRSGMNFTMSSGSSKAVLGSRCRFYLFGY